MTDDTAVPRRRSLDRPIGERMTVVEVELINLGRRFERHADKSDELIGKLDARADRQDIAMARLLAGLTVVMLVGQVLAPWVGRLLGLPT